MQIIELTKEQYDQFAFKHKNHNFYQTSQYGSLMNRHGFIDIYVGLLDDGNNLVGASLILSEQKNNRFKVGYAPRGFLIDFNDYILVENFTKLLKQYLYKLGYVSVKIDPPIIHLQRDTKGNVVPGGTNNSHLISFLKTLDYEHLGFTKYFEGQKPRWNAITKLNASSDRLFTLMDKETRNKVRKAYRRGVTVYKGGREDLKTFYNLVDKERANEIEFYLDQYEIFSKNDMFELYFAKLDPATYIRNSKELYENELKANSDLTALVQKNTDSKNKNTYINLKMNSDKLLSVYKKDVVNANNVFKSYPNGIIIATAAIVKYNREAFFLIDGYNPKFKSFCPNHLMRWAIINEYSRKGYLYINHNGITGDFEKENPYYGLYQFKKGFDSDIVEYIGEFNLIINKQAYQAQNRIKSFKNVFDFKLR